VDGMTGEPFNKATLPIPSLVQATAALGSITFTPDDDGVSRAVWPTMRYAPLGATEMVEVWGLSTAAALVSGADLDLIVEHGRPTLRVDGRVIPLDDEGRMVLRFHGGEGVYRQYNFASVLRSAKLTERGLPVSTARPSDFRGKTVIIGATAAGLLDLRATPMGGVLPGYLIQATALDNLLQGNPIWRVTPTTRAAIVLTLAVAAGALAMIRATRLGILSVLAIAIIYIAIAAWAYGARGIWLDVVAPLAGVAFAWAGATGYAYVTEGRERRFLRDAFSRYLAPDVVEALVAQPGRLSLGGETRELTIMFADVAGFTTLAEGRAPSEVVSLMNECFEELTGVIQRHGGTVDKFIGDAVMAFWNAPVLQSDHAARAMLAGRELLDAVDRVNASWVDRKLPELGMRVGLATGPAVVGNVGSQTKFNYTVMGDTVNLASRLEGAAKVYGTLSLIADTVVNAAGSGGIPVRELDRLRVKGKAEAVTVYEILRDHGNDFTYAEAMRGYAKALETYRAGAFAEAAQQFDAVLLLVPGDGPSLEMKERCLAYMAAPPPPGWRGDHVLTSK
jgi:adenylate cyclase